MPLRWKLLIELILATIKGFVRRWLGRLADAESGAAQQMKAQAMADEMERQKAKVRHDQWKKLTPAQKRQRLLDLDKSRGV